MGVFGALGNAIKKPVQAVNKVVGKAPGMQSLGNAVNKVPGMQTLAKPMGLGPSPKAAPPPPNPGMQNLAQAGGAVGGQMMRPPVNAMNPGPAQAMPDGGGMYKSDISGQAQAMNTPPGMIQGSGQLAGAYGNSEVNPDQPNMTYKVDPAFIQQQIEAQKQNGAMMGAGIGPSAQMMPQQPPMNGMAGQMARRMPQRYGRM